MTTLKPYHRHRQGLALFMTGLMFVSTIAPGLQAATGVWTVNAAGDWSNAANWQNGIIPNAIGDIAIFRNDIAAARTVSWTAPITVGGMEIGDALGGSAFTFSGTNFTFNNGANNAFIRKFGGVTDFWQAPLFLDSNLDAAIHAGVLQVNGASNGPISLFGGRDIIKSGSGSLQLNSSTDSFGGNFRLQFGALLLAGANSPNPMLGFGANGITLTGSGSADRTTLQLRNSGAGDNGLIIYGGNNNINLQGAATINVDRNLFTTVAAVGNTFVFNNLNFGGGLLNMTGGNNYGLRFDGTTSLIGQTNVFNPSTPASPLTLNGPIIDRGNGRALIKEGAGRLVIGSSTNNYSGVTAVKNGILELSAVANLGNSRTFVNGGALSPANRTGLNAVSANGLVLVGQLGTTRYALPAIGLLESYGNVDAANPMNLNVPIAGMALAIDGGSTNAAVTRDINLSQVGSGSNRVWVTNALGLDRTYTGVITPSADNTIRLSSGGNNLIVGGALPNRLGGPCFQCESHDWV
jgi:autotransporter-associated beta strand protein